MLFFFTTTIEEAVTSNLYLKMTSNKEVFVTKGHNTPTIFREPLIANLFSGYWDECSATTACVRATATGNVFSGLLTTHQFLRLALSISLASFEERTDYDRF